MAGDVGFRERAIDVGADAEDVAKAAAPIVDHSRCRVSQQYGSRVLIAEVGPSDEAAAVERLSQGSLSAVMAAVPEADMSQLDAAEALGLSAFGLRQSEPYAKAKAERPLAEESWDNDSAQAPDFDDDDGKAAADAAQAQATPTSERLTDSVAVGLIIVEGPGADLKFSDAERQKVVAEVQNGLSWLGAKSLPDGVRWVYDIHIVTLTVQPGSGNLSFGQKEALWRDPAMADLGYGPGLTGVQDYINKLRTQKGTKWSYCAFFTKYPLGHFAYASLGGPRLVMAYENDGWGPDNIDRVFAHETGHIFNAPDEYAASNCDCGGQWGYYKKPNGNCANCAPGGGVDCLMKGNSWAMCSYTPYHLGFHALPPRIRRPRKRKKAKGRK